MSDALTHATDKPWVILLLLNIVALMILGCFMETIAIMIILVPILIPVLNLFHIDLVHFGIVLLVNLVIGQLTPPVGVLLFVASSDRQGHASDRSIREVIRLSRRTGHHPVPSHLRIPWLSLWLPHAYSNE